MIPNPLASERGDDPQSRDIFERCSLSPVDPEEESVLLDHWTAGYQVGFETKVVRSARSMLGLFPSDLNR
jgi:hypothetical protein